MMLIDLKTKEQLNSLIQSTIKQNLTYESWDWLSDKVELLRSEDKRVQLNMVFSQLPRKSGKQLVKVENEVLNNLRTLLPGFSLKEWTLDRLTRVWLLLQVPDRDKTNYLQKISTLYVAAEMNELIALYSALPFLSYPEEWIAHCEEGIRSNISTVLDAIMYNNPYPAVWLSEPAWNQLILKAFFTEKDVSRIIGFEKRANMALTVTLKDYVNERLAAHRTVHPEIYNLIELGK